MLSQVRSWTTPDGMARSAPERAEWLAGLRQLIDAAEAVFTQELATFDARGDGETLHAAGSTASWLRGALRMAPGDATGRVQIARGTRHLLAEPVQQLADGQVTFDQVRAIERATRHLPDPVKPDAVTMLTELATQADVAAVRTAGQRLRHVIDPDGALADADKQFDRRYLHLSPLLDGMTAVDGLLDPEATTVLTTALAPFLVPTSPDDHRTTAQRRADGLTELATTALNTDQLPHLGGGPTQLQVLIPYNTLLTTTPTNTGTGATNEPAQLPEHPTGPHYLTPPVLDRLVCDAAVARILLGPDNLPMELGRSHRLFTPHQRKALALRDGGCHFPHCNRPARYTDAHHIHPWQHGGTTDLTNLVNS